MGWADPEQIKRTVSAIRERWPDLDLVLHLHDTRGTGIANVYAGMETGVRRFDSSVGGLGGCPFAGVVAGMPAAMGCFGASVLRWPGLPSLRTTGKMQPGNLRGFYKREKQNASKNSRQSITRSLAVA